MNLTCTLTDAHKAKLKALGIDWQTLLKEAGPIVLQIIQILLSTALTPAPAMMGAKGVECPDCFGADLDALIKTQVCALVQTAHLRECCPCPLPTPDPVA